MNLPSSYLWIAVAVLLAAVSGFGYGTYLGAQRLESYQQSVAAVGKAQQKVNAFLRAHYQQINQEVVDDLRKRMDALGRDNATLLYSVQQHARLSRVPPARAPSPGSADGSTGSCLPRDQLVAGIGDIVERFGTGAERTLRAHAAGIMEAAGRGDRAFAALAACVDAVTRKAKVSTE